MKNEVSDMIKYVAYFDLSGYHICEQYVMTFISKLEVEEYIFLFFHEDQETSVKVKQTAWLL